MCLLSYHLGCLRPVISFYKLVKLRSQLQEALTHQPIPARKLASLIGKIISMSLALGPVTWLMIRSLYATLNNRLKAVFSVV